MKAALCRKFGIEIPIIQAPMGGAGGPRLAAAVSNAGALGTIPLGVSDVETLRRAVREARSLTTKPFAVNLNMRLPQEERLEACLEEGVPIISFFWQDPYHLIARAKAGGAMVMHTVGTARDARRAVDHGVDVVVAQGWEAGGHVRGLVATMPLIPAVVDAVGDTPVVAAGGIADGRGMAAAMALGASGVWIGTRFLAAEESITHPEYRQKVIAAAEDETVYCENLFSVDWPDAPHRVLRNSTVMKWEAAGRPAPGSRPGEGEIIAKSPSRGNIVRYQSAPPRADFVGEIEAAAMFAGQSVGLVRQVRPAGDIVREINDQANDVVQWLAR